MVPLSGLIILEQTAATRRDRRVPEISHGQTTVKRS
jgi:hypothetical protein